MTIQQGTLSERVTDALSDRDLIVVSNRQPYAHNHGDDGITVDRPAGGLTAGLDPVMQRVEGTWIAWGDGDADFEVADENGQVCVPPDDPAYTLSRVRLSEEDLEGYYYGYSNQALWPLCHGMLGPVRCDGRFFERYRAVNRRFAEAVVDQATEDSLIWFQDYHFALAPGMVRESVDDALIAHFWHIPWPTPATLRVCPQAEPMLKGLLANDLLAFHTEEYVTNFLDCVEAVVSDASVDRDTATVTHDDHATALAAFPLGIDADRTGTQARSGDWPGFLERYGLEGQTIALGVDRLDYTKGIPERIRGVERFLEDHPKRRGTFTYVQKAIESRSRIPAYQRLQERVENAVERVNDRFGTDDWQPVLSVTEMLPEEELYTLYSNSDLALVTALRDGMNLVAKEYVATQIDDVDDGVLVLSEFTGAHEELGEGAVSINPYDIQAIADGIERALSLSDDERRTRMEAQRDRVRSYDLVAWMDDMLSAAIASETELDRLIEHA